MKLNGFTSHVKDYHNRNKLNSLLSKVLIVSFQYCHKLYPQRQEWFISSNLKQISLQLI
jgi:hypothetical protein